LAGRFRPVGRSGTCPTDFHLTAFLTVLPKLKKLGTDVQFGIVRRVQIEFHPHPARVQQEPGDSTLLGEVLGFAHRQDVKRFDLIQNLAQALLVRQIHEQHLAIARVAGVGKLGGIGVVSGLRLFPPAHFQGPAQRGLPQHTEHNGLRGSFESVGSHRRTWRGCTYRRPSPVLVRRLCLCGARNDQPHQKDQGEQGFRDWYSEMPRDLPDDASLNLGGMDVIIRSETRSDAE